MSLADLVETLREICARALDAVEELRSQITDLIKIRGPTKTVVRRERHKYTAVKAAVETPSNLYGYTVSRYTISIVDRSDLVEVNE